MKKSIEIFVGNIKDLKQGDFIIIASHIYEVLNEPQINENLIWELHLMDNEGHDTYKSYANNKLFNY